MTDSTKKITGNPVADHFAELYGQIATGSALLPDPPVETEKMRYDRMVWQKQQQNRIDEIIRARDAGRAREAKVQSALKQESARRQQQWSEELEAREKAKALQVWTSAGGTIASFEKSWPDFYAELIEERAREVVI